MQIIYLKLKKKKKNLTQKKNWHFKDIAWAYEPSLSLSTTSRVAHVW